MTDEELYEADSSHTDPGEIKAALVLAEKLNAKMLGFLGHYFEAHETRSRVNIHVHQECEKLMERIAGKEMEDTLMPDKDLPFCIHQLSSKPVKCNDPSNLRFKTACSKNCAKPTKKTTVNTQLRRSK